MSSKENAFPNTYSQHAASTLPKVAKQDHDQNKIGSTFRKPPSASLDINSVLSSMTLNSSRRTISETASCWGVLCVNSSAPRHQPASEGKEALLHRQHESECMKCRCCWFHVINARWAFTQYFTWFHVINSCTMLPVGQIAKLCPIHGSYGCSAH